MINIDGSIGEGGGQILRTALGLSMVTGQTFRIQNIRAGRPKPGLLRQHLTAVNAATAICCATVQGASISSQELTFSPGKVVAGEYTFSVGSAGSTTLVLQAVLPALLLADGPTTLTLEGGTHNPFAPPVDFLEQAFLPLITRMGAVVSITLDRAGFYPAGGGRFVIKVQPTRKLVPIHLLERGPIIRQHACAVVAALPGDIAKRELQQVQQILGWSEDQLQIRQLPREWGPGNILTLMVSSESVTEVFTGFGTKGVGTVSVANEAIEQTQQYLESDVSVGQYLADQLMLYLALAGQGSYTTVSPTMHTKTNMQVIHQFLPARLSIVEMEPQKWLIKA